MFAAKPSNTSAACNQTKWLMKYMQVDLAVERYTHSGNV